MNKRLEIELEIDDVVYTFVVNVTEFLVVPPSYNYDAASDLDFHGYEEVEYDIITATVCDEDGNTYYHPTTNLKEKVCEKLYNAVRREMLELKEGNEE